MQYFVKDVSSYLAALPEDRIEPMQKLRHTILESIPNGFEECISYGMIGYVVPFSLYPGGYHCDAKLPLPFVNIASQKNFIALYHMGIYADQALFNWFVTEFAKFSNKKLDMGKSCIRFKKPNDIPFELIGDLMKKITVSNWIETYESIYKK